MAGNYNYGAGGAKSASSAWSPSRLISILVLVAITFFVVETSLYGNISDSSTADEVHAGKNLREQAAPPGDLLYW